MTLRRLMLACACALGLLALQVSSAAGASPWWHVSDYVRPGVLVRGAEGIVLVRGENVGDVPATPCTPAAEGKFSSGCGEETPGGFESTPIVVTATLPEGVEVVKVEPVAGKPEPKVSLEAGSDQGGYGPFEEKRFHFDGFGPEESLGFEHACSEPSKRVVTCVYGGPLSASVLPYGLIELGVAVNVASEAPSGRMTGYVSGGGAVAAQASRQLQIGPSGAATPFGVESDGFSIVPESAGGQVDTQAGSHPFQLTTSFALDQTDDALVPPALSKDLRFSLSPGLVANIVSFPRCTELQFSTKTSYTNGFGDACPEDTAVGVVLVTVDEPVFGGVETYPIPVFNLVPKAGEPARFGFFFIGIAVTIDFHIRTGENYGAVAEVHDVTQVANFISETLTVWGVPGEPVHDSARGWACLAGGTLYGKQPCPVGGESHPAPFLTLPTACSIPFAAEAEGDSWPFRASPGGALQSGAFKQVSYSLQDEFGRPLALTGCDRLPFAPSVEVAPEQQAASTATGLTAHVRVPQEASEGAAGLASASVKDISVTLPEGLTVNPSGANQLEACSKGLVGFTGEREFNYGGEQGNQTLTFTPRLPGSPAAIEAGESEALRPGSNFCSNAAKVGTVKIKSPLVKEPLLGSVYIATQNENPFGSLLAMYLVAEDEEAGVLAKLAGEVHVSETGQLTTTFDNDPELPFEDAELKFFGGERAALATPAHCGAYVANATFTPWSGMPPVASESRFEITHGPHGSACPPSVLPFAPTLAGGSSSILAGAFTPFTTTIERPDGDQALQGVQVTLPPGLEGVLTGVMLCPEAQANEGTCGPNSLIAETTVSAGVGGDPISVAGGKVYLTERYEGAPFGLSIVSPVKAGPFDLEHDTANSSQQPACDCLVVRAQVLVNPTTAAITALTDRAGAHAIPRVIDGIPVQLRSVRVTIDRQRFTFDPTNCNPLAISGALSGFEGAVVDLATPFQITNCSALRYTPKLTASTSAHASKQNGTSLFIKIAYPPGAMGTQSWFKSTKIDIPKQLPARLTTIQKACPDTVFEGDRAACPQASQIGHAVVHTPVLPVPLSGPVYFVSHGGAKFPDVVLVLEGYGITIVLRGETLIHDGVTSATFRDTPDVPFESIEVTLPAGPHSEFTANIPAHAKSLCGQKLNIPNSFTAQNNLRNNQSSPIAITGCPKAKHLKKAPRRRSGTRRR